MTVWVTMDGALRKVVLPVADGGLPTVDGVAMQVESRWLQEGVLSLILTAADGTTRSFRCVADSRGEEDAVLVNGRRVPYAVSDPRSLRGATASQGETGPKPLKAPMPGRIVRVLVAAGESVELGQGCVVIEAMKMQNELKAPRAGVVGKLAAIVGETVASGAVLLVVE